MFKRILVPLDFSPSSMQALEEAVAIGVPAKAELILVHAVEHIYYSAAGEMYGPVYDAASLMEQFAKSARAELARVAKSLEKRKVGVRTALAVGVAHDVIVETARKRRADLIVISTHGRTGLAHMLMGSVAEKVVRHARCAVLVVRGQARRTTAAKGRGPRKASR